MSERVRSGEFVITPDGEDDGVEVALADKLPADGLVMLSVRDGNHYALAWVKPAELRRLADVAEEMLRAAPAAA